MSEDLSLLVKALCKAAFGCDPDLDRVANCVRQLQLGNSLEELAEQMVASSEFQLRHGCGRALDREFLTALYRDCLGRKPDQGGLAHWLAEGVKGTTRAKVLAAFASSAEGIQNASTPLSYRPPRLENYIRLVNSLYRAAFRRFADEDALAIRIRQLETGASLEIIAAELVDTPEFNARYGSAGTVDEKYVTALYRNAFGQQPDQSALTYWQREGEKGATRAKVLSAFAVSDKAIVNVASSLVRKSTPIAILNSFYGTALGSCESARPERARPSVSGRPIVSLEFVNGGGFGNVMLTACHMTSFAIEHNFRVCLLPLSPYTSYLQHFEANPSCTLPPEKGESVDPHMREVLFAACSYARHLVSQTRAAQEIEVFDIGPELCLLEDVDVVRRVERKSLTIFAGYHFRAWNYVKKHRSKLVEWFSFKPCYKEQARSIANSYRLRGTLLVGAHCRGGDYRRHFRGKYFFSCDQYKELINHMRELLHPRSVTFLIATDDATFRDQLREADASFLPGNLVQDLCILAECDYILGPPSTFSLWAAFLGAVPYYHCKSPQEKFDLTDFATADSLDYWLDVCR